MRLFWICTLALAFILAFVFQAVNGDELNKKGPGNKGMMKHNGEGTNSHHPDVGRAGSAAGGPGEHRSPSGDRSRSGSRGSSSSSDRHGDKSGHRDRKHKDKKNRKEKHHKKHDSKKNHPGGKQTHH